MSFLFIAVLGLGCFLSAFITIKWIAGYFTKNELIDIPNFRSSHEHPKPKGGGIGVVLTILIAGLCLHFLGYPLVGTEFWIGIIVIAITGVVEDVRRLPIWFRLLIQIIVSLQILAFTGGFHLLPLPQPLNVSLPEWLLFPLGLLWIVGVINLYNFMDGIDGYAGTQAVIGGIALAIFSGGGSVLIIGLILAFASLGFLVLNWQPAKVFLGEAGATTIGFILACLPFYISNTDVSLAVLFTSLTLWFFLADGAFTLLKRALKGEKIWEAHRSHLYQRLVISGWSHNKVVISVMACSLILTAFAYLSFKLSISLWYSLLLAFFLFLAYWRITIFRENLQNFRE